jgi:UDP-GlcNAc:undecaprenyl-phosphate GlcNAc-1-phosphate transferase
VKSAVSLLPPFVAMLTSLACTYALLVLLPRMGFVDRPNARSSHTRPVPRGGGIALLLGTVVGLVAAGLPAALGASAVLASLAGLLGLVDDRVSLSVRTRLVAQVLLSVLAVTVLLPQTSLPPLTLGVLAVAWIAFVNAVNFMDGINGISATVAIIVALWFVNVGEGPLVVLGGSVMASAVGFLVFNAAGAVFLGDVGSYALGSLIWSMTTIALGSGVGAVDAFAPMSLYGLETFVAMALIALSGGRLGEPHRMHAYQRLADLGLPHMLVTMIAAAALVSMLMALWAIPHTTLAIVTALLLGALYITAPHWIERRSDKRLQEHRAER